MLNGSETWTNCVRKWLGSVLWVLFDCWIEKVLLMTQHKSWFSLTLGLFYWPHWGKTGIFHLSKPKVESKQIRRRINTLSPTYQKPLLLDWSGFCHLVHFKSICTQMWLWWSSPLNCPSFQCPLIWFGSQHLIGCQNVGDLNTCVYLIGLLHLVVSWRSHLRASITTLLRGK